MYDRIFVEYDDPRTKERILLETSDENGDIEYQCFNLLQAKQLVIDLNKLISGSFCDEDSSVEGVAD